MFDCEALPEEPKQKPTSHGSMVGYRNCDCPLCGDPIVDQALEHDRYIPLEGRLVLVCAEDCAQGIFADLSYILPTERAA